jgi:hypothetical protein
LDGVRLAELVPIESRGELVALVSRSRVHLISLRMRTLQAGDPELRFVAYMCAYCGEVLNGRLPGPLTSERAEEWARAALIAAPALNVPLEQVRVARCAAA